MDLTQFQGVTWNDHKRTRRTAVGLVLTGLLAGGLGCPAAIAAPAEAAPATTTTDVVVRAVPGQLSAAAGSVARLGGTVERQMTSLDTLSAVVPSSSVAVLEQAEGVADVTNDAGVELADTGEVTAEEGLGTYDEKADANSVYNSLVAMGAPTYYKNGITGRGVDVAVIDSGVAAVGGLDQPGQLVVGPDLTEESQDPAVAGKDTNGHGTFMAGLIGGKDDAWSPSTSSTAFAGAAPDARIVSVKAANAVGGTDVSQVLAGIDWVVQNKNANGMNIRVLNLSFGTDSTQSYVADPLSYAVEAAWRHGIFVVVSAGNHGNGHQHTMTNPATNPFVLAVGAEDTTGTTNRVDDTIPSWSSWGTSKRSPDLVAPGRSVTSLRVPGSFLDANQPQARIGDRFFRGSGTSQAAAYASGAAALVIQQRPGITPDQLKDLFKRSALKLNNADDVAQGAGGLDLAKAYSAAVNPLAVQTFTPSVGLGTLEASRGTQHLTVDGVKLQGEQDVFGRPFSSSDWASKAAAGKSWDGDKWNGISWSGISWSGISWSGISWSGISWSGISWSGAEWS